MIIELSGIDGAGKSTQIEILMRWANELGVPTYERIFRSIGRRVLGGIAARSGAKSWTEMFDVNAVELSTALEFVQFAHAQIGPINTNGQLILIDTFSRSWLATAIARGASDVAKLARVYEEAPTPELSIHVDASSEVAFERILGRKKGDHILRSGGRKRLNRLADAYGVVDRYLGYEVHRVTSETDEIITAKAIREVVLNHLLDKGNSKLFDRLVQ